MSLKAFHILFVTLASVLSFVFAAWALQVPVEDGMPVYRYMGGLGLLFGAALITYGFWFWRKIRRLA